MSRTRFSKTRYILKGAYKKAHSDILSAAYYSMVQEIAQEINESLDRALRFGGPLSHYRPQGSWFSDCEVGYHCNASQCECKRCGVVIIHLSVGLEACASTPGCWLYNPGVSIASMVHCDDCERLLIDDRRSDAESVKQWRDDMEESLF